MSVDILSTNFLIILFVPFVCNISLKLQEIVNLQLKYEFHHFLWKCSSLICISSNFDDVFKNTEEMGLCVDKGKEKCNV